MENWSTKKNNYQISNKYRLVKADPEEFSIYETVYGDRIYNRFAVKHWDLRLAVSQDNPFASDESFFWIKVCEKKVGGVLIEPNVLARIFIIPPFNNFYEILKLLKKLLLKWSDTNKNIYVYQISPEQAHYFEMLGFWPVKNRRWMMRPTEVLDFTWQDNVIVNTPEQNKNIEIARLFYESFKGGVDWQIGVRKNGQGRTYEDYLDEVDNYFSNTDELLMEASTLIYDKTNNKLIGACLISYLEEWPLIHTVGVHPSYKGRNLAKTMIKKALTVLHKEYSILRLFVTIGNLAEAVYYELGFVSGVEFKNYYLPAKKKETSDSLTFSD